MGKKTWPARYASFLRFLLLFVGVPLIVGQFLYQWFWNGIYTFNKMKFSAMRAMHLRPFGVTLVPSPILFLLAATVEGISVVILLFACYYLIKVLTFYCKGELFSEVILKYYQKLVWTVFLWTLYNPIKLTALTVITTINNPPGQRVLTVALQGEDVFHIFVVGSLLMINSLMKEAYTLKQEHDLTV